MRRIILAFGVLVLYGCAQPTSSGDQSAAVKSLESRIQQLSTELEAVTRQSADAQLRIGALEIERQYEANYSSAVLDPAQPVYIRLDANIGTFAISLSDVREFADGVKIRLNLGNLSSVTFAGATLQLKYGRRMPAAADAKVGTAMLEWGKSLREKQETVTANLLPGHWNPVQVVLPGIAAKDFGYLQVSMTTNMIAMY